MAVPTTLKMRLGKQILKIDLLIDVCLESKA